MKFAMVVLIWGMIRGLAAGQTANAQINWTLKGQDLSKAGQYSAAAAAFQEALTMDEANGIADGQTIEVYEGLASAYTEMGQFANARREYQRALALAEKIDSANILLRGLLVARTAAIPGNEASDKIITELRQAIAATGQTASADQLAVMRVSLAQLFSSRQKYQDAEKLLRDAIADLRKEKNPAPRRVMDSLNALGVLLFNQQRYNESTALFRESLQAGEHESGTEHPALIPVLNNLAASYIKMGQPQDAASVLQRTIAITGKTLGEDHPSYGILLANYAIVLRELGHKQAAKKIDARSKTIETASRRRNGIDLTVSVASLNDH